MSRRGRRRRLAARQKHQTQTTHAGETRGPQENLQQGFRHKGSLIDITRKAGTSSQGFSVTLWLRGEAFEFTASQSTPRSSPAPPERSSLQSENTRSALEKI